MRKTQTFDIKSLTEETFETDEVEHAQKYVGDYTVKTLTFGQKNEAQFKAIKVNPNNPVLNEMDTWAFRFHTLLYSIEVAPGFPKRPWSGHNEKNLKKLEKFIYEAPSKLGDVLLDLADEVNAFTETEQKNLA